MPRRTSPAVALLLLLPLLAACFPELPDQTLVDNLRVLGIRSDPAVADLTVFPPTTLVTVSALVVDGSRPDLADVEHTWSLDLPEDTEGLEELEGLLPEGPYGTSITVDLEALFGGPGGARDELDGRVGGILPLRYRAVTSDDDRDAVKLVTFLLPAPPEGDDDDSAEPEEPVELEPPNTNPVIVSLAVGDGDAVEVPGPDEVMYIGPIDEDGAELTFIVEDDGIQDSLRVTLFRTAGCANLPPEEDDEGGGRFGGPPSLPTPGEETDPCEDDSFGGYGGGRGGSGGDDVTSERVFAWRPTPGETSAGARLFLVGMDAEGGQVWQEVRPEAAP